MSIGIVCLFARFLAENNLLMYPDPTNPVPISLEECDNDLAERRSKERLGTCCSLCCAYVASDFPGRFPCFPVDVAA